MAAADVVFVLALVVTGCRVRDIAARSEPKFKGLSRKASSGISSMAEGCLGVTFGLGEPDLGAIVSQAPGSGR